MPVSNKSPYLSVAASGGSTYNFPFKVFEAADLVVKAGGALKGLNTDYVVIIAAEPAEGGAVVFQPGYIPADGSGAVEMMRKLVLDRDTDYQEAGGFRQAVVDKDFDRVVMMAQDQDYRLCNAEGSIVELQEVTEDWSSLREAVAEMAQIASTPPELAVPWVDAKAFATLAAADAAAVAGGLLLVISSTWNVVPAVLNAAVQILPGGKLNNGGPLTINGLFHAGRYQVFGGAGTVSLAAASAAEVYPEWWGNDAAAFRKAVTCVASIPGTNVPSLSLAGKVYTVSGVTSGPGVLYRGVGAGQTVIQHVNGVAEPVISITGGYADLSAIGYWGFEGLSIRGGDQTTDLVWLEGNVDNNMKYHDLALKGAAAGTNGFNVRDYLNWSLDRIRFDGIGGYAFKVRLMDFGEGYFHICDFTYDNNPRSGNPAAWGSGFFYIDTSAKAGAFKGAVHLENGRLEINLPLQGAFPSKSLFRVVQDQASALTGSQSVRFITNDVTIDASNADSTDLNGCHFKIFSCNYGEIGLDVGNMMAVGMTEVYGNDAGNQKAAMRSASATGTLVTRMQSQGVYGFSDAYTVDQAWIGSNVTQANADAGLVQYVRTGDIVNYTSATSGGGRTGRPFALKAVMESAGYHFPGGKAITQTGSINAGSAVLALSASFSASTNVFMGMAIVVAGAGAGGADLKAKVINMDFVARTLILDTNAGTTVAGAALSIPAAVFMAADMVFYGTSVPASGNYKTGDRLTNTDQVTSTGGHVLEWTCTQGGSPGTWRATKWTVGKSTTANRPALTTADIGVMYLDTTLAAAGKPIWWTGTAWVDATGTAV